MNIPDKDQLRKLVNPHLGNVSTKTSKPNFEKAKSELIIAKTAQTKTIGLLTLERYLEIVEPNPQASTTEEKIAADYVDSYFIPLPSESINAAFTRAKKESIAKLKREAAQLKYFTFNDYSPKKTKRTSTSKIRKTNFDNVRVEKRRST